MNNKKTGVIVALAIAIVALVVVGAGLYMTNTNKYTFTKIVTNSLESLVPNVKTGIDYVFPESLMKSHDKISWNSKNTVKIADTSLGLNIDLYSNLKAKKYYIEGALEEATATISGFLLLQDNKVYFTLKNFFENIYYTEYQIPDATQLENIEENANKIVDYLKKSLLDNIKDNDFSSSNEKISLNGKDYDTKKIVLEISQEKALAIEKSFFNSIKTDQDLVHFLAQLTGVSDDDMKASINDALVKLQEAEVSNQSLYYAIYVKNNKALRHELYSDNKSSFILNCYENSYKQQTIELQMKSDNLILTTFKFEAKNETEGNISILSDNMSITGTYNKGESKITINLTASTDDEGEQIKLTYEMDTVKINEVYKLNITLDIPSAELTITSNNTIDLTKDIPTIDVSKSLDVNNMSAEDQEIIQQLMSLFTPNISL